MSAITNTQTEHLLVVRERLKSLTGMKERDWRDIGGDLDNETKALREGVIKDVESAVFLLGGAIDLINGLHDKVSKLQAQGQVGEIISDIAADARIAEHKMRIWVDGWKGFVDQPSFIKSIEGLPISSIENHEGQLTVKWAKKPTHYDVKKLDAAWEQHQELKENIGHNIP
jgi:hypothetical protein